MLDLCMDEDWALARANKVDLGSFVEVTQRMYWRNTAIRLPLLPEERKWAKWNKNVTVDFIDYITTKALNNFLDDTPKQYLLELLRFYNVIETTDWWIYLDKKIAEEIKETKQTSNEESAIYTVMKEWMDWYFSLKKYKLTKQKEVNLGQDYKIRLHWKDLWTLYWAYTPALRWAMFADKTDYNRDNRTLETRQYEVVKKMWWMTFIAAPRRAGKTWLMAFLAVREIIRQAVAPVEQNRPIRVLYIWLSDAKTRPARDYILNMSKKYRATWMFSWRWDEQRLSFKDADWNLLWVVDFISAKSYEAWVWEYADLVLIDEAARIKESVYSAILPIVTNEWARLICVSTLVWNTKKNWFYRELIKAERDEFLRWDVSEWIEDMRLKMWLDKKKPNKMSLDELYNIKKEIMHARQKMGVRFTIDDIEHIPERQKEFSKQELSIYPDRYLAELYSVFSNESKVFQYETALRDREKIINRQYDYLMFCYDPAIKWDIWAVVILWYQKETSRLYVIAEREMPKDTYNKHPEALEEIKTEFLYMQSERNINKCYTVADITGNYWLLSLFEVKWYYIDCKVHYTSWEKPHQDKQWIWKVPKEHLVQTLKDVLDGWAIVINSECWNLINEMNYFQMTTNDETGKSKYEAIEWHDDYVNALMTWTLFVYHVMWEKYSMLTSDHSEKRNETRSTEQILDMIDDERQAKKQSDYDKAYREHMRRNLF